MSRTKMAGPEPLAIVSDRLQFGARFAVTLQRTLRIPDDGEVYELPAGLGRLPIRPLNAGVNARAVVVPLHVREALWLGFDVPAWYPHALLVGLGRVNAVTGDSWRAELRGDPQNYLVCPPQLWLDGVKIGPDRIRQFVAMPIGSGESIEAQIAGTEEAILHLVVVPPRAGVFADVAPLEPTRGGQRRARSMNLGAGGQMRQRLYPDPHGMITWDESGAVQVDVHLATIEEFESLTGEPAPPTPIDARTYAENGLPWFELYDEPAGDLAATETMRGVRPLAAAGDAVRHRAPSSKPPHTRQHNTKHQERKRPDSKISK